MRTIIFLLLPFLSFSQVGPLQIIDSSSASTGISKIIAADINNDQSEEIIASFTGSNGRLGYYQKLGGSSFSTIQIIDSIPFLTGVESGDFNKDGWQDLIAIGGIENGIYYYQNNQGNFENATIIDTNIFLAVNDIAVKDFDQNGSDDIVVIGQHSINFYRNNGNGNFTKEEILTTDTSPKPLECLDLATADIDSDGDQDLVCAETAGLVVYINSGSGEFDPQYYSEMPEIGLQIHLFDVDGDQDKDVVMRTSLNEVKWFSNDGNGHMSFESLLDISHRLHSFQSIDFNDDGLLDLYATYTSHVSIFLNDDVHSFSSEITIVEDSSLFMDEIGLFDIDQDGRNDYVWSGKTRMLAYHLNQIPSSTVHNPQSDVHIYPNPARNHIWIDVTDQRTGLIEIYNLNGQLIDTKNHFEFGQKLDISHLNQGMYFIIIDTNIYPVFVT